MKTKRLRLAAPIAALALSAAGAGAQSNHNLPLDRPYSLRNPAPGLLEAEYARMILAGTPMTSTYPRPCLSGVDSSRVCGEDHGWTYREAAGSRRLALSPQAGYQYRHARENVNTVEMGALATGSTGPLSFYLDARMFTELHEDPRHVSYDREFVEKQDEEASGSIAYSSYSRYRSNLNYDMAWGRLTVARDAVHWGPGLFANLAFNQGALPFNQVSWSTHLGPVSVATLYGRLTIRTDSLDAYNRSTDSRSLYAHRYEWRAGRNLLAGISEQLVFFNEEDAFAFVPVVPLFIAKGTRVEAQNNGNISADLSYRWNRAVNVYTEFLIDDLQSPTSLFDDFWGNKWAWMCGAHAVGNLSPGKVGVILEYSRLEPWVYTHYQAYTAQVANGSLPLGNPQGPNSQWMVLKGYFRDSSGWYASARGDLLWKGRDRGSSLQDDREGVPPLTKVFLDGIDRPTLGFSPYLGYAWKAWYGEASASLGRTAEIAARIAWRN